MPKLEFWYEFASTYSYPAALRCAEVAAGQGVELRWRPFLLGPIFQDLGWTTSPFNLQPAKGTYMWRDLERSCARRGLPFVRPDPFPQNGLRAARLALALEEEGARAAFTRAVFRAQFAEGENIASTDVLSAALAVAGADAGAVWHQAQSEAIKAALRAQTETARAAGIFGAPTWRTPDGEIFWGNDRLEDALDWMRPGARGPEG